MNDRLLPYFAYGSNLNPSQMAERCPGYRVLGRARLDDHAIRFQGYGRDWEGAVATVVPAAGSTVYGVLFALTDEDYASLDEYEGFDGPGAATSLYDRVERTIVTEDGRATRALLYLMRPDAEGAPSGIYLNAILEGMRHHGLPQVAIAAIEREVSRLRRD